MNENPLKVAIIGASGIGKNHAAWFAKNGAQVCAFVGSNRESIAATGEVLRARLGYMPRGYCDVPTLWKCEELDIVCVASPPHLHYEHVAESLQDGAAVLCEKPLVYDPALSGEVLCAQADELVAAAQAQKVLLGTQMQYGLVAEKLCGLAGARCDEITSFTLEMETKNLKPGRSHETIWIELAPHPLSVLQKIAGVGQLKLDSIECQIGAMETRAGFQIERANGKLINAQIITRCNPGANPPLRRFTLDGTDIDYAGRKNADGDFLTYLSTQAEEIEMPDLVDLLIGNFIAAVKGEAELVVTGEDGARNVAWMMQILESGKRVD